LVGLLLVVEPAEAQVGTRFLAPPIPAGVDAALRARAEVSDAHLLGGELKPALAALWADASAPGGRTVESYDPGLPEWSLLRRLAGPPPGTATQNLSLQRELSPHVQRLLGPEAAGDFEIAWRAARIAMALGFLAESERERSRWYTWGVLWGMEAVVLDPDTRGTESRFWLLANLGQLALRSLPVMDRGRASQVIHDLAQSILAIDPSHAGAHTTLGRNHLEVRGQNLATRTLARVAFGNEFVSRSSFEGALNHLERGARLDPGMIYYQMEWAHGLWTRGERDAARGVWRQVESLPVRLAIDPALKAEARRRLAGV